MMWRADVKNRRRGRGGGLARWGAEEVATFLTRALGEESTFSTGSHLPASTASCAVLDSSQVATLRQDQGGLLMGGKEYSKAIKKQNHSVF